MTARPLLPGMRWLLWIHNVAVRVGVITWIYVFAAFAFWQFADYGIPQLERFAGLRDLIAGVIILVLLMVPVFRFHDQPVKLFLSGVTAWTLLTFTYVAAALVFPLLETRMGVFQIFTLGNLSYVFIAVFHWVFLLCAEARSRHIAETSRAASPVDRPRTR